MSCNDDYKDYIGWYFISSCTCGETAVDAVKNVLNKKIGNDKDDFTVGNGLNIGILFLMIIPYIILFFLFRKQLVNFYKTIKSKS